jgi:hypothetical protein
MRCNYIITILMSGIDNIPRLKLCMTPFNCIQTSEIDKFILNFLSGKSENTDILQQI